MLFVDRIINLVESEFEVKQLKVDKPWKSGDITFDLNVSLYIDHIYNFDTTLNLLADPVHSPIEDDGYTGIDIFTSLGSDNKQYIVDGFLFYDFDGELDERVVSCFLDNGVSEHDLNWVMKQCNGLKEMGFQSITFVSSDFHREQYEKSLMENKKREQEDLEEHYTIEDYIR